jgi:uncharacterized protein YrrD
MRKSRKIVSMPIVSLEEGIQIGSVRSLVVNPGKMEIAAIIIDQRGWFKEQKIIPYSKVSKIGNDAITIDKSANVQKTISLPEILKLIKEKVNPIKTKVVAENGSVLGHVDEYYIDEQSGKITSLLITGRFLEALFKGKALLSTEYVRTMGADVIIVKEDAFTQLEKIDGGVQETIRNLRKGTASLWESTKQQTKEISKTLKEKYDQREKKAEKKLPVGSTLEGKPGPADDNRAEDEGASSKKPGSEETIGEKPGSGETGGEQPGRDESSEDKNN